MGTVVALAAGLGLTVLGLGAADEAVASFDAASWVWSRAQGEVARVNGVTAKIDTRVDVGQAKGHALQVSQSDRFAILRDVNTGAIGTMDLTDLQAFWNSQASPGNGVSVALHDDAAFVIDTTQGKVQQIDPSSLQPIGEALAFPPGITAGAFDDAGLLWIAAPSEGTVTGIQPAPVTTDGVAGTTGPQKVRTETVASPSHDLKITTLDAGVGVLDSTNNVLTRVTMTGKTPVSLPLTGPADVPAHTDGSVIPVTVTSTRQVLGVGAQSVQATFTVPGSDDTTLQPAVAWEGYYYVAEEDGDTVHVFDAAGTAQEGIEFQKPGGSLELEVRESYLFINAPGSSTARVVDDSHGVRTVDKYADDVLGGDAPPVTTPRVTPPKKETKPKVTKPGAPKNVRAAAGNAEVRVTWQAAADNGAPISKYVVVGNGQTMTVGADQRSVTVTGLTNGETYTFEVHAVNKKGDGPAKASNPVKPTSEVPDPPGTPVAEAQADGTVKVTWPAANGQGLEIERYTVTAVSEGGGAPVGDADDTTMIVPAGTLEYGTAYSFTVVSVNERGAGSKTSEVSNSVVPFAKPEKPADLDAATVGGQAGAISVTWTAPAENGRPISKYVVTAGGKETEVTATSATLTGLGDGATVQVSVVAVNEAGESEPATASARTVAAPAITLTGTSTTYNTGTVAFSVDAGGGTATCSLAVTGGGTGSSGSCTSLKATKLSPSTSYTFTITAKNAAGQVTKASTKTTADLYGTATCINGDSGDQKTYCDSDVDGRNGNEIFSVTRQDDDKQVGWVKNGVRLKTYCKKSGDEVYAYVYNDDKKSTWWVQISYEGKNYIPWAWLNLDGGDDLSDLPTC
ncbi:fibronectin type III domain-containing protein [Actinoplanes sp. NPDC051851]|uniref:fibronectin type III domain-containing protein n=1 Tax=Actinoplanes sp. NPDC051851 TaxID=3154753 RepID=UPI003443D3E3